MRISGRESRYGRLTDIRGNSIDPINSNNTEYRQKFFLYESKEEPGAYNHEN